MNKWAAYSFFVYVALFVACEQKPAADPLIHTSEIRLIEKSTRKLVYDSSSGRSIPQRTRFSRKFISRLDSSETVEKVLLRKLNVTSPDVYPKLAFNFRQPKKEPQVFQIGTPKKIEAAPYFSRDINPHGFSLLGIRQGLPDQMLRGIIQDSIGFIWIAHQRSGLTRFDGTHFFNYSVDQGLPTNDIYALCTDKQNLLWIGSNDKGLFCFDGNTLKQFTTDQGLCSNSINTVYADARGRIWAGSNDAGVSVIENGKIANLGVGEGIPGNTIWRFLESDRNTMIIAGSNGLSFCDSSKLQLFSFRHGLPDSAMWSLNRDKRGNILIGTANEGLMQWDGSHFSSYISPLIENFSISDIECRADGSIWLSIYGEGVVQIADGRTVRYGKNSGISGLMAVDLLEDREGSFWVVSYGSDLSRLGTTDFYHIAQTSFPQKIKSIFAFDNQTLWLGSSGQGIFELANNKLYQLRPEMSPGVLRISCMQRDKPGNIWVGTIDNGIAYVDSKKNEIYWFLDENKVKGTYITDLLLDRSGKLWIASDAGLSFWNGSTFISVDIAQTDSEGIIRELYQDMSNAIWIVFDQGLAKMNGDEITHYSISKHSLDIKTLGLFEDNRGDIWLGTEKDGLLKLRDKNLIQYTSADGLIDNTVLFIRQDMYGNYLIGHALGLSKIRKQQYFNEKPLIDQLVFEDGYTGVGTLREGALAMNDGTIWVLSNTQLSRIDSRSVIPNKTGQSTYLNGVTLFGENVDWHSIKEKQIATAEGVNLGPVKFDGLDNLSNLPQNLILPYSNNFISFSFAGISHYQASNIKYAWMLEGADDYWSVSQHSSNVRYANLAPGSYRFLVKSTRDGKNWSTAVPFSFSIAPPWWKTKLMYGIYVLCFIGIVWAFIAWRNHRLLKRAEKLEQEVEKATHTIREQKEQVTREKEKSDNLLLNILPQKIAEELKETGFTKARLYKEASVLFTDFKGFTAISERLSTSALVDLIHVYFSAFDIIMERNGIEKIKTIGDAYMAVGGMPGSDPQHAYKTVKAALEIKTWMQNRKNQALLSNEPYFEVRIGVHSGPVVAGVVGTHKFQYDVWGDTVNTASRLESSSEAGKVNISGATYELIKDSGTFTHRGKIAAKGKGEIDMYFVDSLR